MMKNAFYFTLKLYSFSRYLNFCLDFLVMYKNGLIRKIRLISKFMTLQSGKQTIAMHILPNISRSKGNQTLKFGQLIECNIGNIFLYKLYTKCGGESILRPLSKKQNSAYFRINSLKFYIVCFYCMLKNVLTAPKTIVGALQFHRIDICTGLNKKTLRTTLTIYIYIYIYICVCVCVCVICYIYIYI